MNDCNITKQRKARKEHSCCECGKKINKGEYYFYDSGIFDCAPYSYKTCGYCSNLRDGCSHLARKMNYSYEHYPHFTGLSDFIFNMEHYEGFPKIGWIV